MNTTFLGKYVCVIWYTKSRFEAREGTYRTFWKLQCSKWIVLFPFDGLFESYPMCMEMKPSSSNDEKYSLLATIWFEAPESIRRGFEFKTLTMIAWPLSWWSFQSPFPFFLAPYGRVTFYNPREGPYDQYYCSCMKPPAKIRTLYLLLTPFIVYLWAQGLI